MRNLTDSIDQYGMFVNKFTRSGDEALQRLGMYYFIQALLFRNDIIKLNVLGYMDLADEYESKLNQLRVNTGVYRRHPNNNENSDPHNVTRDQLTPNMLAMGIFDLKEELIKLQTAIKNRWYFYQNIERNGLFQTGLYKIPDIQGPEHRAAYERFFLIPWYKKPLLYLSDLWFLIGTIWRIKQSRTTEISDCSDDINLILMLIQSQEYQPTFLSRLAIKVYSKFIGNAPNSYGSTGVQSRLDCYFREESGREPFNEVIKPLIPIYFK